MKNNSPVVWVVQEGKNNYAPAEEYGTVKFVTSADFTSIPDCMQNGYVRTDLAKFRSLYIPSVDFILPSGNPMVVALLTMSIGRGPHNFLKWDGRRAVYIPHTLAPIT